MLQVGRIDDSAEARKDRLAHQELVDFPCCLASFSDGPHHQGLSTVTIYYWKDRFFFLDDYCNFVFFRCASTSGCEDSADVCAEFSGRCFDVGALVFAQLQLVGDVVLRAEESERQKDQVAREHLLRSGDRIHPPAAVFFFAPFDAHGSDPAHDALAVVEEFLPEEADFFFTDAVDAAAGIGG